MTENEIDDLTVNSTLSRRQRRKNRIESINIQEKTGKKLPRPKMWLVVIWSLVLALTSVANPFLSSFANNLQSQNLYAGMAMQMGQIPYENFFGTKGVLYYLLVSLGSSFGTTWILVGLQFIALVLSGIYFYQIIAYITQSEKLSTSYSNWFYLLLLTINFGGLYAGMFALPFIVTSIWFLIRYFDDAMKDEWFILYGADAALVFLIYPKSLIFWLIAGVVLLVFNSQKHQLSRGIYQFLATIFGFLFIIYLVGYYAFESQILGTAIQQTFLYNLQLDFFNEDIRWTLVIVGCFMILSGFLKNILQTIFSFWKKSYTHMKTILLLTFLIQLLLIIGSPDFHWNQLLLLLPYGFVLGALQLIPEQTETVSSYLRQHFFLPLLISIVMVVQPLYSYYLQKDVRVEREQIASIIAETTKSSDKIFTWDNSASIYLESRRVSSTRIIAAKPYLNNETNKNNLMYDLNKNEAIYIVVNKGIAMSNEMKDYIELYYSPVESITHFTLYQKNE
ncbi:TPA: quinol oxidase [Streptococcus suis]